MLRTRILSRAFACLAAFAIAGNTCATAGENPFSSQPQILLAHHEGATSSVGVVDLLGTQPGGIGAETMTDSLWGNLLIQMAYARDKQLSRSAKKLKLTDSLTLAGIYGIAGVSLAQSVTSITTLNQGHGGASLPALDTTATAEAEHEGGAASSSHDHSSSSDGHGNHHDSYAPSILGLISSGSTLVTLGLRFYFGRKYSKQIKHRQLEIKAQVEGILAKLDKGESLDSVRSNLVALVGERATREFSGLWRATHQIASAS